MKGLLLVLLLSALVLALIGACAKATPTPTPKPPTPTPPATATATPHPAAPTPSPAPTKSPEQATYEQALRQWDDVVKAAKKEGVVVHSPFGASPITDAQNQKFEQLYGIRVEQIPGRTGDFKARWDAEKAAGKFTIDSRSSGAPEIRLWGKQGMLQSYGLLPAILEPGVPWHYDPLTDVRENMHPVISGFTVYYMVVNNKLVPPEMGPRSHRDLADPKFKGLLLIDEPLGPSPGTVWAAHTGTVYGLDFVRAVIANVKALSRSIPEQPKQIARGEYGLAVTVGGSTIGTSIYELSKPWPFRIVEPEDGVIVVIGGYGLLQNAPHPNAAKVYLNFLMTKEGQQIMADYLGGSPLRKDLVLKAPELQSYRKLFPTSPPSPKWVLEGDFYDWYEKVGPTLKEFGLK